MADADYSNEIWKTIAIAPDYAVSDHGRVQRITVTHPNAKPGHIRKQLWRGGYLSVSFYMNGKQVSHSVHHLVAAAFLPERPTPLHIIAHNDGDASNNRADNLRWATPAENTADRKRHGTMLYGETHAIAKLTEDDIRAIRASKETQVECARRFGTTQANVSLIRRREAWTHVP